MAHRFFEQKPKPSPTGNISPEAVAIWEIAQDIVHNGRKKKVFLIHMPRGATPIVEGIDYASRKLLAGKRPFEVVKVPLSRENFPRPEHAKKIISDSLEGIPRNSLVYYVDETRRGFVTSENLVDIEKVLAKKGCILNAHFIVADAGTALDLNAVEQFRKSKAKVELHEIPGKISWRDNTAVLGYNWGLMHRFPEEALEMAIGKSGQSKAEIENLKKEFIIRYNKKIRLGKEKKFRTVLYSGNFYAKRQQMALDSFKEAVEATGFGKRHRTRIFGEKIEINGKKIPFWNLQDFLFDNHPRTEIEEGALKKRIAYRRLLLSDPDTLVDIREIAPKNLKNTKRLKREIGMLYHRKTMQMKKKPQ